MTERMTHTRSGSATGSTGPVSAVRTRPRVAPAVAPPEMPSGPPAPAPPARPEPASSEATEPTWDAVPLGDLPPVDRPSAPRPRPADRRAQRAARRRRRHLAVGCAVLVAFCLAVTILIVVMAGNRTPGPQVVSALTPAAARPNGAAVAGARPLANRGAPAPERDRP